MKDWEIKMKYKIIIQVDPSVSSEFCIMFMNYLFK